MDDQQTFVVRLSAYPDSRIDGSDMPEAESKPQVNWLCFWSPCFMRKEFVIGNQSAYGGVSRVGWGTNDLLVLFPFLISRFLWVSLILFPVFPESLSIWISFFLQVLVTSFILPDILSNHCLSCGFHDLGEWYIKKRSFPKRGTSVYEHWCEVFLSGTMMQISKSIQKIFRNS